MFRKYLTTVVGMYQDVWQFFKLLWAEVLYKPQIIVIINIIIGGNRMQ